MLFGTKNNRPAAAARTTLQCALDHDAACNTAVAEADGCEAKCTQEAHSNKPIFPVRKPANAMTFNVDLHDAWTRA